MNKSKKNTSYINNKKNKTALYTNNLQKNNKNYYMKNLLNITNSSNSRISKDLNNKSINFNNINSISKQRNKMSSLTLYKNYVAVISPHLFTKKYYNSNISLNKGTTPMSFEKAKTTSHQSSHKNLGIINYNNFISPKNTLNNTNIIYKNKKNSKSHTNLRSPINKKNHGKIKKYNSILLKNIIKDDQKNDSKVVNLKYKNYIKFNGLKKNNKIKKYQSYNQKKNNNEKKK
jgi:hypothetical protein